MPLPEKRYQEIRNELDNCKNPLFLFDDDPDGTASYLLLYRYKKEGYGMPIKSAPKIDTKFLHHVRQQNPDIIFVLDIPMIDQEFLDQVHVPVIWIDHHGPFQREKVRYYNPRTHKPTDITCTSENCYHVVKQDLWIAMIGIVGDWQFPKKLMNQFRQQYPDLLPKKIKKPEDALFASDIGRLVKMISFMLKGSMSDVRACMSIMTRLQSPYEILRQESKEGTLIYEKAQQVEQEYNTLLNAAKKKKTRKKILLYLYDDNKISFTKELSNELLYLFPTKIIIVGRRKNGEYKLSLRATKVVLRQVLEKALVGISGYGGGHEHACGACVKEEDMERFLRQVEQELRKAA